ncbi:MAG: TIGR03905 family TSCPD domain-containing protein [Clostridia bacterium]|nr:TIGR03905 family TSCPD domain-containing protein [Clostridia bacterium]
MNIYITKGTCSRQILFEVTPDGILKNVKFINGCSGNLQAISKLTEGKHIDYIISTLKGIKCRGNTSCADQLATALLEYKNKHNI